MFGTQEIDPTWSPSVAQLGCYQEILDWVQQYSSVMIDHEIFSMVIFSLLLIQEGQLSVCGNRMYTQVLVN